VDSSNVAWALSFNAFTFFATNAALPTTALSVGADGIAFATAVGTAMTAAGAATSAASAARTAWRFGQGVAQMVQYLPPLLLTMWTQHNVGRFVSVSLKAGQDGLYLCHSKHGFMTTKYAFLSGIFWTEPRIYYFAYVFMIRNVFVIFDASINAYSNKFIALQHAAGGRHRHCHPHPNHHRCHHIIAMLMLTTSPLSMVSMPPPPTSPGPPGSRREGQRVLGASPSSMPAINMRCHCQLSSSPMIQRSPHPLQLLS
jgi:hypothetical protein